MTFQDTRQIRKASLRKPAADLEPYLVGSCWPTQEQILLLKAALLSDDDAASAWKKWDARVDIEAIDPGSFRLLPLLYHNIAPLGLRPRYLDRIKGCYRMSWTNNMMHMHQLKAILRAFATADIPAFLTKGIALVLDYYEHPGLRPMEDIDLLVPKKWCGPAWDTLSSLGYTPKATTQSRDAIIKHHHAWSFYGNKGQDVDLHWHILTAGIDSSELDADIIGHAVATSVQGTHAQTLCPTDLLFQVCIHGAWWCAVPPLRWVADATMILRQDRDAVDWERLVRLAARGRLSLPLLDTLTFLDRELQGAIPASCLRSLANLPTTSLERRVYRTLTSAPPLSRPWPLLFYTMAIHFKEQGGRPSALLSFPGYLKHNWELESLWHVPFIAALRGGRSFLRKFRKTSP